MEYLPDLESALNNITTAYYRNYAFLGSWSLLDYVIRMNYTKRSVHTITLTVMVKWLALLFQEVWDLNLSQKTGYPYRGLHSSPHALSNKIRSRVNS